MGAGKVSLDAESLQFTRDGGFYVGDEYAANVYRFDRQGRLLGVITPPRRSRRVAARRPTSARCSAPQAGRRNNQGAEGMSLSPGRPHPVRGLAERAGAGQRPRATPPAAPTPASWPTT